MKKSLLILFLIAPFYINSQSFWTEVNGVFLDPNIYCKEISIVDANVVWINGGFINSNVQNIYNLWSKSEDGGITWTSGLYNLQGSAVGSIKAISTTTAYVTTYKTGNNIGINGIWITTDSGITWTQQTTASFSNINSFVNSVYFWNENDGIVIGDPINDSFEIYTTTNGGTEWVLVEPNNIPSSFQNEYAYVLNYDVKGNSIWFGTNKGRVFHSSDRGLNWTVSQSPIDDFGGAISSGRFSFKNESEGLLISSSFEQWRTIDSGNTWTPEIPTGAFRNSQINYVPFTNNTYFLHGPDNQGYRGSSYSNDGGQNWIDLETEEDPIMPYSVKFQSGLVGFCIGYHINNQFEIGGTDPKFFRLTDPLFRLNSFPLATTNFKSVKTSISPNPTSGIMKIFGNLIVEITIFDVLGNIVMKEKYNTLDEVSLDLTLFENGVYLTQITSANGIVSTLKIIKN